MACGQVRACGRRRTDVAAIDEHDWPAARAGGGQVGRLASASGTDGRGEDDRQPSDLYRILSTVGWRREGQDDLARSPADGVRDAGLTGGPRARSVPPMSDRCPLRLVVSICRSLPDATVSLRLSAR